MSATKSVRSNKSNVYCSVPQCNSYYSENISFHTFPTDKNLRNQWIHALKIGKQVSAKMRICSKHFRNEDYFFNRALPCKKHVLKKNSIPTQNLPKGAHDHLINHHLIQERQIRREKRQLLCDTNRHLESQDISQNKNVQNENDVNELNNKKEVEAAQALMELSCSSPCVVTKKHFEDKAVQVNSYKDFPEIDVTNLIDTDFKVRILTGIYNLALLQIFSKRLKPLIQSNKIGVKKMILLTMMRIKLDLPFSVLSVLFNISSTTAQRCFQKTLPVLAAGLKSFIIFPSKEEIAENMPQCFSRYPDTRIVLDCTEIAIQTSKCLKCRIQTYSFYKGRHTIKVLFGTAPSGLITFVSKAYGGRASDKAIFNNENLISALSSGDAIMVDKGFLIDKECQQKSIKLIRPPFLRNKKQLSKAEAEETAHIARARVHIERTIQRIKLYRICRNILPWTMLPYVNDVITVIVALTNLSAPVLAQNKY